MRPPCEIIVQELLPLLRGLIAFELTQKMTQQEAAERMGVSQPTISTYLKSLTRAQEAGEEEFLDNPSVQQLVSTLLQQIEQKASAEDLIQSVCSTCVSLRIGGLTCRKHYELFPALSQGCKACLPAIEKDFTQARQKVLSELDEAVALIEAEPSFVKLVPEVLLNICLALPSPKTIDDVAAIPGRITKIRGLTKALLPPEFGVSQHLAKLLLAINHFRNDVLSIIAIKFNPEIKAIIEVMGIPSIEWANSFFEALLEGSAVEKQIEQELLNFLTHASANKPFVIFNTGAVGIEPIAYCFSHSAVLLAQFCSKIAKKL
ncbi:MAG: thiamine-phosphate synthase family protein [Candidatus Heimdallarchaeota archaeon]